jgi:hypothetical protein
MRKQIATTVIFAFWSGIYLLFGSLKPYYCLPYILVFCCILLSGKILWSANKIICQGPSHLTVILWRVGSLAPGHNWNRGAPLTRTPWSPHVARIVAQVSARTEGLSRLLTAVVSLRWRLTKTAMREAIGCPLRRHHAHLGPPEPLQVPLVVPSFLSIYGCFVSLLENIVSLCMS